MPDALNEPILLRGDCMELLKTIPDRSVDMVCCDLPYGILDKEWDKRLDAKELFSQYRRVCKQGANVLLFCQMSFAKFLMDFTYPSEFSHCLIWIKNNRTRFLSTNLPMSQYEMIVVFRLNKFANEQKHTALRKYFLEELQKSGMTVPELEDAIPNRGANHWFRQSSDYRIPTAENYRRLQEITGFFHRPYKEIRVQYDMQEVDGSCYNPGYLDSDVIYSKLTEKRYHPTQKPVSLLKMLILAYSDKNDIILDNTMGVGSTGVACIETGRRFIGMELSEEYFTVAKDRLRAISYNQCLPF